MLKSPIDIEEEISTEGSTNLVDPSTTENAVVEQSEVPEEVDARTSGALKLRYRIFNGEDIRMQVDDNKNVWFVADDIVKILGYSKDTASVIKQHCNKVYDTKDVDASHCLAHKITVMTNGGMQSMIAISEPDLYRLIMRSKMPDAIKFEGWVMEEVLPSIRKTGKYKVSRKIDYKPAEPAQVEASEGVEPVQLELFPCNLQSVSFPRPLTDKINAAKKRLYDQGHTFPNNKEFVKFLVTKALETLED